MIQQTIYVIHRYFWDEGEPIEAYSDKTDARARADYLNEHTKNSGFAVYDVPLDPIRASNGQEQDASAGKASEDK